MDQPTIEEIELSIDEAKEFVELGEALKRLENNPDFKKLILEDYLRSESIRLVEAKALPNLQDGQFQSAIIKAIDAIGGFREYLRKVDMQARQAAEGIADSRDAIAEMEAEAA